MIKSSNSLCSEIQLNPLQFETSALTEKEILNKKNFSIAEPFRKEATWEFMSVQMSVMECLMQIVKNYLLWIVYKWLKHLLCINSMH